MEKDDKRTWETRIESELRRLADRLEALSREIETAGERIGQHITKETATPSAPCRKGGHPGLLGGIVMILFGVVWMGHALDWWTWDIPWVPVVLIVLGIYLVLQSRHAERDRDSG